MTADKKGTGVPKKDNPQKHHWYSSLPRWVYAVAAGAGVVTGGVLFEVKTSYLQSKIFHSMAEGKTFTETRTSSPIDAPLAAGPYDERLGYTKTLLFREKLSGKGYELTGETTWQDRNIFGIQLFPLFNEKAQAGLKISDETNHTLFEARFPRQIYPDFESIPPVLVNSLLFVENRELLGKHPSTLNPAIEWERLANAMLGYGLKKAGLPANRSGGSTLATQLEKFRHSPDGITGTPADKVRQMLTASVRSYRDGGNTVEFRRRIVLDYLNSMPLSSYPGFGEVNGFADGMTQWFGADFKEVNRLLHKPEAELSDAEMKAVAKLYRESFSLIMSVKKPTAYLVKGRTALQDRVDLYLPLLVEAGIISERMKNAVAEARVEYADPAARVKSDAPRRKAVDALQVELLRALDVKGLYELNRLDIEARTTVDGRVAEAVAQMLRSMTDPATAEANGLTGFRLLNAEDAGQVIYTFSLYEKTADANLLRVQTDNFDGPLNLNEGGKLELGSTAKLRTLVTYLEAVTDLHTKYAAQDAETLRAVRTNPSDNLSRWALEYFADPVADKTLAGTLEAALERTYSANPGERFFTGGGLHRFENFDKLDNGRTVSVKEALHRSVNLPFIRIMRDIVNYTQSHKMNIAPDIFENPDSPARHEYLKKFADAEGQHFMWTFWGMQKQVEPSGLASLLAAKTGRTPVQLAVVFRHLYPEASVGQMADFIRKECGKCATEPKFDKLYEAYGPGKFDLNDQGYITRLHPLELWMASHRLKNPDATWEKTVKASEATRIEVYKWLFRSDNMQAQNSRIRSSLEKEAFVHIHKTWKEKGFPFAAMVPSYASALGASGDTPAALAELAGILQNDGVRKPTIRFHDIEFGKDTPYEMHFKRKIDPAVRVLPQELTQVVRREMQGVIEKGTARRAFNSVKLGDGRILVLGGKTGTGDNRLESYAKGGGVISSNVKSRTAAFVFAIDDRFYGSLTAYVPGEGAAGHKFTSSLPVQVFKTLVPAIRPVLDRSYDIKPEDIAAHEQKLAESKKPSKMKKPPTIIR